MTILSRDSFQRYFAGIISLILLISQHSSAQTYLNFNFTDNTNKYSLLTDIASITFNGTGGIIVTRTDNSISTETMSLLKHLTLDATNGGGAPLPVELVSFSAASHSGIVSLLWMTATEVNNYGFEIERTMNNGQWKMNNWSTVGFVEGSGTTNSPKEYSTTDKILTAGKYVYRLKQIDRDGKCEFSKEVEVTVTGSPTSFGMEQNYPNPFNPSTTFSYQLSASGMTTLDIYDALGRKAATLVNEIKDGGNYTASFDGSNLASGIYYARLTSNGKMQMRKMLMLK